MKALLLLAILHFLPSFSVSQSSSSASFYRPPSHGTRWGTTKKTSLMTSHEEQHPNKQQQHEQRRFPSFLATEAPPTEYYGHIRGGSSQSEGSEGQTEHYYKEEPGAASYGAHSEDDRHVEYAEEGVESDDYEGSPRGISYSGERLNDEHDDDADYHAFTAKHFGKGQSHVREEEGNEHHDNVVSIIEDSDPNEDFEEFHDFGRDSEGLHHVYEEEKGNHESFKSHYNVHHEPQESYNNRDSQRIQYQEAPSSHHVYRGPSKEETNSRTKVPVRFNPYGGYQVFRASSSSNDDNDMSGEYKRPNARKDYQITSRPYFIMGHHSMEQHDNEDNEGNYRPKSSWSSLSHP